MTNSTSPQLPDPIKPQPSPYFWRKLLPLGLAFLVVAVLLYSLLSLPPRGLGIVADFMFTCMCLLPLVICLFPVYIMMMAAIYGLSRVNGTIKSQMHRAVALTENMKTNTTETTSKINQSALNTGVTLAKLDVIFNIFNRPSNDTEHQTQNGNQ
jgi:hypothetical protein